MKPLTAAIVRLGQLTLDFGRVDRATFHPDGVTRESDTDHTVMLNLTACAVAHHMNTTRGTNLNVGLISQFAAVHDLHEVYAGDTNTLAMPTAEATAAKRAREHAAGEVIRREFAGTLPWLTDTIDLYEQQTLPEARFVRAMDKLLPKITHLLNGGTTFRVCDVTPTDRRARYDVQEQELLDYAADLDIIFELRADLIAAVLDLVDQGDPDTHYQKADQA